MGKTVGSLYQRQLVGQLILKLERRDMRAESARPIEFEWERNRN